MENSDKDLKTKKPENQEKKTENGNQDASDLDISIETVDNNVNNSTENQDVKTGNELSQEKNNSDVTQQEKEVSQIKVNFNVGDKVSVHYKIVEGEKSRIQPYEGIVIGIKGSEMSKTFTVRRIASGGVGVERIFPVFSPNIELVKVKTKGKVRRAKLYYLRNRVGKAATKVKEKNS